MHSVQNIPWTQRQMIIMTVEVVGFDGDKQKEEVIVTKLLPGTRRKDFIGMKASRDLDSINMISDDHYLLKFRASDPSARSDYWSLMGRDGQI